MLLASAVLTGVTTWFQGNGIGSHCQWGWGGSFLLEVIVELWNAVYVVGRSVLHCGSVRFWCEERGEHRLWLVVIRQAIMGDAFLVCAHGTFDSVLLDREHRRRRRQQAASNGDDDIVLTDHGCWHGFVITVARSTQCIQRPCLAIIIF